ncbi:type II toxin-antitoxin system RelE/ParE family toxin [Asticcacaulis sp. AC402]|uniref:type II toxin-antitoxin system RelE/ParE family toxin n=1 Tax=Asticcacaulis sp. AC402 TaxID=1282361 RepID=UPI0003C40E18|nr:type II toxin-antitoxin system RelE/ParE family toxin [Asticcacaulis sp. AC402]ESQ75040.1 hypothetical protein ABAC402_11590 [Asticcacaulis sp. AC402]
MSGYRLSLRAETDLLDIFIFGIEQFGVVQAEIYQEQLTHCFELLAESPRLGRPALVCALGQGMAAGSTAKHDASPLFLSLSPLEGRGRERNEVNAIG